MSAGVVTCRAMPGYRLSLRFADGLEGEVFLGELLEVGAFKLWRNVREFEKVRPMLGAVAWDGGVRLDPDVLWWDVAARAGCTDVELARQHVGRVLKKDIAFQRFLRRAIGKAPRRPRSPG